MQDKERIIINDYIENDPLSENNLDKTLNLSNEFRLSGRKKSIWLYTGYVYEDVMEYQVQFEEKGILDIEIPEGYRMWVREQIISQCDVRIDGRYIEEQRDITLPYRGSRNQRIIDVQKSLREGRAILWKD